MSYSAITLTIPNTRFSWNYPYNGDVIISDITDLTATANNIMATMPEANVVETGTKVQFNNIGPYDITILDYTATVDLIVLKPGSVVMLYLTDNSSIGGIWRAVQLTGGSLGVISLDILTTSPGALKVLNGHTSSGTSGQTSLSVGTPLVALNSLNAKGIIVSLDTTGNTFATRTLVPGSNIAITNSDGTTGDMIIAGSSTLTNLVSINVGQLNLSSSTISTNQGNILIYTVSPDSFLQLNNATIDTKGNISCEKLTVASDQTLGVTNIISNANDGILHLNEGVTIDASGDLTAKSFTGLITALGDLQVANLKVTSINSSTADDSLSLTANKVNVHGILAVDSTINVADIISNATDNILTLNSVKIDSTGNLTAKSVESPLGKFTALSADNLTLTNAYVPPGSSSAQAFFSDANTLTTTPVGNVINLQSAVNIKSVTGANGFYNVNFTAPFDSSTYLVQLTISHATDSNTPAYAYFSNRTTSGFTITTIDRFGNLVSVTAGICLNVWGALATSSS